jgi:heat shock protein HslJ
MKHALWIVPVLCAALGACASSGGAGGAERLLTAEPVSGGGPVAGVDWMLREIRTPGKTITLDREKLAAGGMGNCYTLRFDGENRVTGTAAPNRYNGPCTWGGDGALSFGLLVSTKMAALKEPEALKEHEYFEYLRQTSRCEINQGRLELIINPDDRARRTVMVFGK